MSFNGTPDDAPPESRNPRLPRPRRPSVETSQMQMLHGAYMCKLYKIQVTKLDFWETMQQNDRHFWILLAFGKCNPCIHPMNHERS